MHIDNYDFIPYYIYNKGGCDMKKLEALKERLDYLLEEQARSRGRREVRDVFRPSFGNFDGVDAYGDMAMYDAEQDYALDREIEEVRIQISEREKYLEEEKRAEQALQRQ